MRKLHPHSELPIIWCCGLVDNSSELYDIRSCYVKMNNAFVLVYFQLAITLLSISKIVCLVLDMSQKFSLAGPRLTLLTMSASTRSIT